MNKKIPKLILISGPSGAGKSTLTREILKKVPAVWLDKDRIDEPFSPNDRGDHYTSEIEPKVLSALLNLADLNLSVGNSCVLDLPWTHILIQSPHWVAKIESLAKNNSAELRVIELSLPSEVLRNRLIDRGLERDQGKLTQEGWPKFLKKDHIGAIIGFEHFLVSAQQPLDNYLPKVIDYIAS